MDFSPACLIIFKNHTFSNQLFTNNIYNPVIFSAQSRYCAHENSLILDTICTINYSSVTRIIHNESDVVIGQLDEAKVTVSRFRKTVRSTALLWYKLFHALFQNLPAPASTPLYLTGRHLTSGHSVSLSRHNLSTKCEKQFRDNFLRVHQISCTG